MAEPGHYTVQVALHYDGEDIVSNPLRLKITPPRGYEDERIAQDLFTDDVGRVLTFDGSRVLAAANNVLRDAAERPAPTARSRAPRARRPRPAAHARGQGASTSPCSRPVPMQSAAEIGRRDRGRQGEAGRARTGLRRRS